MSLWAKRREAGQREARRAAAELEENMMTPEDLYRVEGDTDMNAFMFEHIGPAGEDDLNKLCAQATIIATELKRDEEGEI